jgi:hypothetical protein
VGGPGQARQIRETTRSVKSLRMGYRSPTCLEAVSTSRLKERVQARFDLRSCAGMTPAPEHQRQHRALKVVQLDAAALDRPCTRRVCSCGRDLTLR